MWEEIMIEQASRVPIQYTRSRFFPEEIASIRLKQGENHELHPGIRKVLTMNCQHALVACTFRHDSAMGGA